MPFAIPKTIYTGKIKEVVLGRGPKAITVGGETSYPFHLFEGEMPHPPRIALEVYDTPPDNWAEAALEPYRDVIGDPVAWAKKAAEVYGADLIALQLISTDPNGLNAPSDQATETAKKVAAAVEIPVIVNGSGSPDKDAELLRKVAEACDGMNLVISPVVEENYKQIGAGAIAYKHTVAANSPIDINLAKQLNILLGNLGVPDRQVIVDPTTGGLGYGIEYTYSVMERDRMAALTQQDERLQFPIICNMAKEVWKTKEAKAKTEDAPLLGDAARRGIIMEAMTATLLLLAGADVLVMRHPEAVRLVREMIKDFSA
ncbi:MAG: acetyl-CoA decarbonylase/synthase complex subunit delta [Proteobacteria bacterium]|nr:acetyl-CoA decarbonylase/synthase complex subunit delta [Pseudomonadota bacterium]MBU1745680.1 acetyl-CoA decarbonylase/synthase complex subunit delta [Pseudomonadota bacterium]MBU4371998.1 acetyl-CoA decarbonylase/synthase complex subunit delta [Pseudomonadota bacterium]MBU4581221.1 acetyl-CoA decarbonylase/synthase complex subunit delta [Pseudomonadota bacterium]MCG2739520.1 acetyl-CoA decarbonylase/synthase complex subunit delta [Syntrophaceae bacterium]